MFLMKLFSIIMQKRQITFRQLFLTEGSQYFILCTVEFSHQKSQNGTGFTFLNLNHHQCFSTYSYVHTFFLLLEKTHPCLVMDSALTFLTWQLLSMIDAFHDLLIHEILVLCIMRTCLLSSFCSICNSACLTRPKESLLCPYDLSSVCS